MLKLNKEAEGPIHNKALVASVIVALVLGAAFEALFGDRSNGLSVVVFMVAAIMGLFLILQIAGRKPKWSEAWIAIPLLFFAAMIAIRASDQLKLLNTVAVFLLFIVLVYTAVGRKVHEMTLLEFILTPLAAASFLRWAQRAGRDTAALARGGQHRKTIEKVLMGTVLAIPFIWIFLMLFSSADSIFGRYVKDIVDTLFGTGIWGRVISAGLATIFFLGAFYLAQRGKADVPRYETQGSHDPVVIATFLGLIDLLFLAFVVIQVKYLFGKESDFRAFNLTYAEYGRSGFFELAAVAAISFVVLLVLEHSIKKEQKHALSFKLLGSMHVALVLAIVCSAIKRMSLYEGAYGYTVLRFYVDVMTLWVAAVFLILLAKILAPAVNRYFGFLVFASVVAFAITVNVMNPDVIIATRNIDLYRSTGKVDAQYLGFLSADAVQYTIGLLDDNDEHVRKAYAEAVRTKNFDSSSTASELSWPSYNVAKVQARTMLMTKDPKYFIWH